MVFVLPTPCLHRFKCNSSWRNVPSTSSSTHIPDVAHLRPGEDLGGGRIDCVAFPLFCHKRHQLRGEKGREGSDWGQQGAAATQPHRPERAWFAYLHEVGLRELPGQLPPPALPEARGHVPLRQPLQRRLLVLAHPFLLLRAERRGLSRLISRCLRLLRGTDLETASEAEAAEQAGGAERAGAGVAQPQAEQQELSCRHGPAMHRPPGAAAPHAAISRQNNNGPVPIGRRAKRVTPTNGSLNSCFPLDNEKDHAPSYWLAAAGGEPSSLATLTPQRLSAPIGQAAERGLDWQVSQACQERGFFWKRSRGLPNGHQRRETSSYSCLPPTRPPASSTPSGAAGALQPPARYLSIATRLWGAAALLRRRGAEEGVQRLLPDHGGGERRRR